MADMNHLVCPVSSLSGSDVSQHGWDPPVNTDLSFLYKTFETLSSILSSFKVSVKVTSEFYIKWENINASKKTITEFLIQYFLLLLPGPQM